MESSSLHFAHRFDQVSGSAIREIFKVIAKPGMISFAGGNPSVTASAGSRPAGYRLYPGNGFALQGADRSR